MPISSEVIACAVSELITYWSAMNRKEQKCFRTDGDCFKVSNAYL